jgi:ribonuclease PH
MRLDNRKFDELRPLKITRNFISSAAGSAFIEFGNTKVLCTASVDLKVPDFLKDSGKGWVTAEYGMLPASTPQRKAREARLGRVDGRTHEIQRLIGRAMRAVIDLELLVDKTIWIDCDVIQADGGTRTAGITGAFIAVHDALQNLVKERLLVKNPIKAYLAAISVGKVKGELLLDLCYEEDSRAEVDMNVVMTEKGGLVEIQGTAEQKPFSDNELSELLALAKKGLVEIFKIQHNILLT